MFLDLITNLFAEIAPVTVALVLVLAFVTSMVHGATGIGGGFLMAVVLAPIIGVKAVVPVLSIMLVISNISRSFLNIKDFHRIVYWSIAIPAVPCLIAGALIYGKLSSTAISLLLGVIVTISIPLRRWASSREIKATRGMLHGAGIVYGTLSGATVGAGMLLIPFMLGYGISRMAFVATLSGLALTTNATRVIIFGATSLLDERYIMLGILTGLATLPGNWIGRSLLRKMSNQGHQTFVDVLTILGALNFFWIAIRG